MCAVKTLRVSFIEILCFDLLLSHELFLIPEPNEGQPGSKVKIDPQFHLFANRNTHHAELQCVPGDRDLAISIHRSFETVTVNIIEGLIRSRKFKPAKQASILSKGFLIRTKRDFPGGGVKPLDDYEIPKKTISAL